jgi:Ser/Thr protein kinase RdoA (MazF antagonist)
LGREVARLHCHVREVPDPHNYLDTPDYELNLELTLTRLVDSKRVERGLARDIEGLIAELIPCVLKSDAPRCFVHNDLREFPVRVRETSGDS